MNKLDMLNNRGATLVEVLASTSIFAIGIVSLLSVCTQGVAVSRRADAAYITYNLAKNHIETLSSTPFSDLASAEEENTKIDSAGVPDEDGTFTRTTEITPSYQGDVNLTQVRITVSYQVQGRSSASPMEMTSVIYQNG